MLTSGTFQNKDSEEEAVFTVEVIPGKDSDPSKLDFTWSVQEMTERQILIQMNFEDALYVSANEQPDTMRVTFADKYMFVGTNNIPMNFGRGTRALQDQQQYLILEREMPRQIQRGSTQEAAQ